MEKLLGAAIAIMVGVEIAGIVQTSIAASTGVAGVFENTPAGTILQIIPLVLVVGLLFLAFWKKS